MRFLSYKASVRGLTVFCGCLVTAASLNAAVPHIFFSDLESAPNVGGENDAGAWVTIYGKNFGQVQQTSYVTIGPARAAAYRLWTDSKIAFQLGNTAQTGEIVVTTRTGASNGIPFTIRPGKIYFVASSGKDSHNGSFASPWRTLPKARNSIRPGDIVYAMNKVAQLSDDGEGWNAAITVRGEPSRSSRYPKAIVAYPGATVVIGSASGAESGIRSAPSGPMNPGEWVFAGLIVRGRSAGFALWGGSHWRLVANDISCPNGDGPSACLGTTFLSKSSFLGNNIHDSGKAGPPTSSALYHGVYFGTDSNHIDFGWNTIANVHGCRGIQVHSTPQDANSGYNQYDIVIHDNVIHDTQCDGIVLATVDPSKGRIQVYNNVIYNAGKGPKNPEQSGNWSCIYVPGYTNKGSPGAGIIDVDHNTMYNCGSFSQALYENSRGAVMNGEHNPNLTVRVRNNIIYQTESVPYLVDFGIANGIIGSNNLFCGSTAAANVPSVTESVMTDPLFANLLQNDFHLTQASPARGKGVETGLSFDKDGIKREGSGGCDIGAFQFE